MIKFNTLKDALQFRICESDDNYWIEDYWKAAVEIFTKNCADTIKFIQDDCTDEEFFWLSEIFENIAAKTQSKEFISALRARLAQVTSENYRQQNFKSEHMRKWINYSEYIKEVGEEIKFAEGQINE